MLWLRDILYSTKTVQKINENGLNDVSLNLTPQCMT